MDDNAAKDLAIAIAGETKEESDDLGLARYANFMTMPSRRCSYEH
jgi:hypothetical protein